MRTIVMLVALAACGGKHPDPADPDDPEAEELEDASLPEPTFATCEHLHLSPDPNRVLATLERNGCAFGWCPFYSLVVYRDGLVQYLGWQYVMQCEGISHLEPDQVQAVVDLFVDAEYMNLDDSYEKREMTDGSTIITSYSPAPGETKTIRRYTGNRHGPAKLRELEDALDRIVNIEQFIGTKDQRERAYRASL